MRASAALRLYTPTQQEQMMSNETDAPRNEGEGSRSAAEQYNEALQSFIESGRVGPAAREAAEAFAGKSTEELKHAEAVGRSHAKSNRQVREI